MEFKQLEMFVALAEERHVQRAAGRVFRTQPAVSMAIAKLEEEVGSSLFIRSEGFRMTPAGETLYAYARRLLDLREEATAILLAFAAAPASASGPRSGRVHISRGPHDF